MKIYILFVFSVFFVGYSPAQDITLRVLGQSNYVEYAESNVVLISANESNIEKIDALKDSISANGLDNELNKVTGLKNQKKVQFKIEDEDLNVFDKLLVLCSDLQIKVDKVYFKMPEHLFEEEDKKAIWALNNANSQAKILANHLGYKIDKILNIDDDTTYSNSIYDDIEKIKDLCDRYYKNPSIKYDDILNAHLHSIYLINIDKGFTMELDPQGYVDLTASLLERSKVEY